MTTVQNLLSGVAITLFALVSQPAISSPVLGQGTWETTLQPRDLDGDLGNGAEAYYDTSLGVTWLADAFQARTSAYQARPYYAPGDYLLWPHAVEWASNLTLYGITDWRLPRSFDSGLPGCTNLTAGGECGFNVLPSSSEMAYMFHTTLGNMSYLNAQGVQPAGSGLTNTGPFSNLNPGFYWSETESNERDAWGFSFNFGSQANDVLKTVQGGAAWAVLDGDRGTALVTPVPEPSHWLLLVSGLLAVVALTRRNAN